MRWWQRNLPQSVKRSEFLLGLLFKAISFLFSRFLVVVVVVRTNPNPKTHDLMENASRQKQRLDEEIIIITSEAELKWRISSKSQISV